MNHSDDFTLNSFFDIFNENPIPIKWITIPMIRDVILSPVIVHAMKNATSDGIVIIAPIIEPLKKIPDIGEDLLLTTSIILSSLIKIKFDALSF